MIIFFVLEVLKMTNLPRFTLSFPDDLLNAVDDYQKDNGISTRSKAIHELVMAGIEDLKNSGEYAPRLSPLQSELIDLTANMSDEDIRALIAIARRLCDS